MVGTFLGASGRIKILDFWMKVELTVYNGQLYVVKGKVCVVIVIYSLITYLKQFVMVYNLYLNSCTDTDILPLRLD